MIIIVIITIILLFQSLLQKIFKYLADCQKLMTEEFFNLAKKRVLLRHTYFFNRNKLFSEELLASIILKNSIVPTDGYATALKIDYDQFETFVKKFIVQQFYFKFVILGNMTKGDAIETICDSVKCLNSTLEFPNIPPIKKCYEIPRGSTYCQVKSLTANSKGSILLHYYQILCPGNSLKLIAMAKLFRVSVLRIKND